ncbi:MAG TPA: rhodanese-like domain-containing protein [Candidatus Acidoferrales bacterium]|jgi:rhodanese-related sulfurtransferase|nr:rhodanese-like domain-containing protein [Candidatus Acidoferrales bacterium]
MKAQIFAGIVLAGVLAVSSAGAPTALWANSAQAGASAKSNQGASASAKDALPFPKAPRIAAEEVEQIVKEGKGVVIVDTDDSESYAAEHIKGSINIVYDPTTDASAEDQSLSALPGDKLLVFYCNCPHEEDSAPLVLEMQQLGYDPVKVKALQGGLTRWEQLHYPLAGTDVDKTKETGQ